MNFPIKKEEGFLKNMVLSSVFTLFLIYFEDIIFFVVITRASGQSRPNLFNLPRSYGQAIG